ncbi:type VI secretion system tube protein TssD [Aquimarina aquimarini]|uniref:type VI secretion system tube protein TssD n=1 Tax=Aquimarina aquimarini TaxID=1191734 RepID=UPI000D551EA5|nr:type VI secretion system tube protein TssD [Aquimarina aquimarini]
MATKTELIIENKTYSLLECTFDYHKPIDYSGRPSARVQAGSIMVVIDFDGQDELINWAGSDTTTYDGKIIFYKGDGTGIKFTLDFKTAFCTDMSTYHSNLNGGGVVSELMINAHKMSIKGHTHTNNWPVASKK